MIDRNELNHNHLVYQYSSCKQSLSQHTPVHYINTVINTVINPMNRREFRSEFPRVDKLILALLSVGTVVVQARPWLETTY